MFISGEPYGLIYKSDTGQNGADCQLTWDCNNGDATVTIDRQGILLLFISYKFVKGFLAITFLLLVILS